MTLPATSRRAGPFSGNGVTTAFPFTFKVFATSDIVVVFTSTLGVETTLVLNSGYTVVLNGDQEVSPGGTVTYPVSGALLASGETLTVAGALPYDQTLDLPSGGNFSPLALENALDRTEMQLQQVKETAGRALTLPLSDTTSGTLPSATTRAFRLLGFTSTGVVTTFPYLAGAAGDAAATSYLPAGTGATVTSVQAKLREIVSVKDFGATGNGATDDTAAIQLALNAGQNGAVYFPTGNYKVSSALTVNPNTHVFGSGSNATLRTNSATANIFNISGQFVYISDLSFNSSVTRTGGFFIDILSGSHRFRLQNFWMTNAHSGICIRDISATVTISEGQILNCTATTGIGIKIEGGLDVSVRDILMDHAAQIFAGIYITKSDDIVIEDCQLITCGNALYLHSIGTVIVSVWANNTFCDNSNRGLYINATAAGTIARCLFDQCWFSSNPTQGVLIDADATGVVNGIDFNGCHVFLNQLGGISIFNGNCTNIQIHDCAIAGNTGYGVSIGTNISYVSVQDCNINNGYGAGANDTGIFVAAGTGSNLRICNNNLSGNTTGSMLYLATGSNNVISGNIGYSGWLTYTPTIVSTTGTITTLGTVVAKYQQINKTVTISLDIPITTNGTGGGFITATAPFTAASAAAFAGREDALTGVALSASIAVGSINILVTTATGAYPGADGRRLIISGTFNVA